MLARCVNVAEQALHFAVQINAPTACRGKETVHCAAAMVSYESYITAIAGPLLSGELLAPFDDLHGRAAVLEHQCARGIDLDRRCRNPHVVRTL